MVRITVQVFCSPDITEDRRRDDPVHIGLPDGPVEIMGMEELADGFLLHGTGAILEPKARFRVEEITVRAPGIAERGIVLTDNETVAVDLRNDIPDIL